MNKQELIKELENCYECISEKLGGAYTVNDFINYYIELAKQLDEPKECEIVKIQGRFMWGKCNVCNSEIDLQCYNADDKYCSKCGAKIKRGEK